MYRYKLHSALRWGKLLPDNIRCLLVIANATLPAARTPTKAEWYKLLPDINCCLLVTANATLPLARTLPTAQTITG